MPPTTTKPKTIAFGSAPIAAPAKKTIPFGSAPIVPQETSEPEKKGFGGHVKELAKGLVTAPATIVARPFQAIQGGVQYIQDRPKIKEFEKEAADITKQNEMLTSELKKVRAAGGDTSNIAKQIIANNKRLIDSSNAIQPTIDRRPFSGGVIAPTPENFKDVKKDVGRAAQTVALGLGPVSGGALFGAGSSVEQGNDILSIETAFNTVLGAGAGKVLDLIGKPLLNASGKVIGKITPETLKKVAEGGADAITKFAAQHEILPAVAKTAVKTFEKGANAVDEGVNKLFTGTGKKIGNAITKEYPGLSREAQQKRFRTIEEKDFAQAANEPIAGYKQAAKIYNNAKNEGTDLAKVAVDNGIEHNSLIEGGKYNTLDTANMLREDAMKTSHDLIRPALEAAEPGVQKISIDQVRKSLLEKIDSIPPSQITATEREVMKRNINKEYSNNSAEARAHPDGYTLTNLHDNKIAKSNNGKYKFGVGASDTLSATQSRYESSVFKKLLEDTAPPELDIASFNKELEKKFQLADYLEALNTKKIPQNLAQRATEFLGKIGGASVGSQFGGTLGGVAGYHLGGILTDSFTRLPNPLKSYYLRSIEKTQPEIFNAFKAYLGEQETLRLMRPQLPAPKTIFQGPTQSGQPYTPNRLFGTTPVVETKPENIPKKNFKLKDFYAPEEVKPISLKAAELTKKNGGVTINLNGDVPEKGFAYSPYKEVETVIPEANFSQADVDNFIEKYYDKLNEDGNHLGVWIDDGKVYIDISKVNPDENAAVADSIANNQIGLFDLSTFETKLTKDYEKIGDTYIHKGQK